MMRILRKGERYALNKPNEKNYFLSSYIRQCMMLLISLFSFHFVCFAQESRESGATGIGKVKPLQIGDTIPEELWHMPLQVVNHPDGKDTITLNDYRDKKLIILDFMHTRCSGCLKKLGEASVIQQNFQDDMFCILLSPEEKDQFKYFLKYQPISTFYQFPLAFVDQHVLDFFQYRYISHFVWIFEGKVIAITGGEHVDNLNVEKIITTGVISLPLKDDFREEEEVI